MSINLTLTILDKEEIKSYDFLPVIIGLVSVETPNVISYVVYR